MWYDGDGFPFPSSRIYYIMLLTLQEHIGKRNLTYFILLLYFLPPILFLFLVRRLQCHATLLKKQASTVHISFPNFERRKRLECDVATIKSSSLRELIQQLLPG